MLLKFGKPTCNNLDSVAVEKASERGFLGLYNRDEFGIDIRAVGEDLVVSADNHILGA